MADEFVSHLEKLYDHYKPDVSKKATPDQILGGMKLWPKNLTFDQTLLLINHVVNDLVAMKEKYGKQNILVDERLQRFLGFVSRWKSIEYQAIAMQIIVAAELVPDAGWPEVKKITKTLRPFVEIV